MSRRFKVAVLGCGRVSSRYRDVLAEELADRVEVVGACDRQRDRAESFVAVTGGAAVGDMDALVALKPDLVCILTESGNHARDALTLLERGCNVLIEKPVALRLDEAEKIRDTAAAAGLMAAVVKQNRYNPAMRFVRGKVDSGAFGRLIAAEVRVHWCRYQDYYEDGWHGTWKMDGGVLAQQAIHHLDALQWLGGPIARVCAVGKALVNRLEAEDTAAAVVEFESGAVGTIVATTAARDRDFEASVQLVGERARAKVGGSALNRLENWFCVDRDPLETDVELRHSQEVPSSYGLGHGPLLADVLDAIEAGSPPPVTVDSAMMSLRLMHALYASMETGGWVDLAKIPVSDRLGLGG
ncbi:Gfo/Idh/MocA family oxidoreductase [Thalassobaculum sp. OXR-137]|uniref:Gfo/Idh/MocA family protein n=1 Tax=Thalassobaculum sp. OXR-137 TaxID=3100173 RepID=UPI002AC9D0FF|nr:Gfo/Idh/MocA family oxidoreductase [Thalassobaculum sp. OXR-137]WPZ32322.1 Gfo/Idh/MocA family oxidoreductase [Thalassobaculum sp. OXR-137]